MQQENASGHPERALRQPTRAGDSTDLPEGAMEKQALEASRPSGHPADSATYTAETDVLRHERRGSHERI